MFNKSCPVCAELRSQLAEEKERSRSLLEQIMGMKRDGFQPPMTFPAPLDQRALDPSILACIARLTNNRGPMEAVMRAEAVSLAKKENDPAAIVRYLVASYSAESD